MEIRELAETVLFGDTLEHKLTPAGRLTDERPGRPVKSPDAPGRPPELALDRWSETGRVAFQEVRSLERDEDRGLVLHFFANHELMAAELMALVLLKFPDAPARFRRGVARTLLDEQEHLRLYLERIRGAGVAFGQIPVSDFFWRAIAPMPTPLDFVTRLSLTLEQANLDYAPHYQRLFDELGDGATAALMERIYRDEIGHVRHGLNWFNTWRAPGPSEWESFRQALGFPLSPSRAKGIGFNREGRLRAGLPRAFVDELELFVRSHGRCPRLHWFNPLCDLAAGRGAPFTPPAALGDLARDLALLPALLAAPDDMVVVPERPSLTFLQELRAAGLPVPELVEWDPAAGEVPAALDGRRLTGMRPWGWAPDSIAALGPLAGQLPAGEPAPESLWHEERRQLYSKAWSAAWLTAVLPGLREEEGDWICGPEVVGSPCRTEAEVAAVLADGFSGGWRRAVVKAAFGAAGGRQILVDAPDLPEHQRRWLTAALQEGGTVVVESWLDRVLDLSAQYEVDDDGSVRFLGITRFLTGDSGRFQGVVLHDLAAGLDEETRRFLYGDGRDGSRLQRLYSRLGEDLGRRLPPGYHGPLGVDALVYRDGAAGGLRLKPVVELNPRLTMGRVGLALEKRVLASRSAVWRLWRLKDLTAAGHASAAAWADRLRQRLPLEMSVDGRQISRGAVFTNDPAAARAFVGVLAVAEQPPADDLLLAAPDTDDG